MDGIYFAGDDLDIYGTHVFTHDHDFSTWRIRNTECGWKIEEDDGGWKPRAITYPDFHKEDCEACTGSCKKEGALTTDEVYYDNGVTDGNLWPEVSLALGHYDGGTFVAA